MPGSGWMTPKPAIWPSPTQPDHTATAAAAPITRSGHGLFRFTAGVVVSCVVVSCGLSTVSGSAGATGLLVSSANEGWCTRNGVTPFWVGVVVIGGHSVHVVWRSAEVAQRKHGQMSPVVRDVGRGASMLMT